MAVNHGLAPVLLTAPDRLAGLVRSRIGWLRDRCRGCESLRDIPRCGVQVITYDTYHVRGDPSSVPHSEGGVLLVGHATPAEDIPPTLLAYTPSYSGQLIMQPPYGWQAEVLIRRLDMKTHIVVATRIVSHEPRRLRGFHHRAGAHLPAQHALPAYRKIAGHVDCGSTQIHRQSLIGIRIPERSTKAKAPSKHLRYLPIPQNWAEKEHGTPPGSCPGGQTRAACASREDRSTSSRGQGRVRLA